MAIEVHNIIQVQMTTGEKALHPTYQINICLQGDKDNFFLFSKQVYCIYTRPWLSSEALHNITLTMKIFEVALTGFYIFDPLVSSIPSTDVQKHGDEHLKKHQFSTALSFNRN